ncbi:OmpA family protein [Falsigemmobacter faecalis]|uniref:OmpA family protein n=1 Tax=Falsigemmobacter faecalis TaxID=2488730 RepID=A0A3P3DFB3_9RHOB|nr:OmpA family protein [Falsigemmobacter faecalis]RRH72212.1 OmpA family protein [Falsigemmobacter faecalis]
MTAKPLSKALPLLMILSLAACGTSEIGSDLPAADFGNATMNNGMIQSGELNYVMALGTRFAQEVPSTITFAFNSAELDGAARQVLAQQAHWIRQFPEVRFKVYGHTDAVGSGSYNYRLGLRRAQAVVAFLASQGVSRARLEAVVSHGKTQPLIPVPGPERANRRTVTEVTGFVARHPTVLHGKYAEVIFRDYVGSAGGANTTPKTSVSGG